MKKQLRLPKRQSVLAISELSQQINNEQQARELVIPEAAYQLIPGYLQSFIQQTDNIIRWFLPHSINRLIDIALPYSFYSQSQQQQTKTLARYILFNRKLVGIRLCPSKQKSYQIDHMISPSPTLQKYYKQNKIDFTLNEIFVGDFYLQMMNCRIGLFFEAELINFSSFRQIYERYRFDIVSVVSNIQKEINKDEQTFAFKPQQKDIQYKLKQLSKETKSSVMFGGIKIVPNLRTVYWQKSFIIQDANLVTLSKRLIGEKTYVAMVSNTELSLQNKWAVSKITQQEDTMEEEMNCLCKLEINANLRQSVSLPSVSLINLINKRFPNEFVGEKELIIYNLWYLFKTVNKGSPFVIPFPFSEKRQQLVSYLIALSQHSTLDLNDLIKVYRFKVENSVSKYQIKIYDNFQHMLSQSEEQFLEMIYFYGQDADEMNRLKNNSQYGSRVCNCQSLIPITAKQIVQAVPSDTITNKKLQNVCIHVLKERFQNIQQILAYFWDSSLSRKEIQKCFSQIIPNKVKKYFKLAPHYLFFLQSTPQQIVNELGQAQIRLKIRGKSRIVLDELDTVKNEQNPRKLVQRIEAARKYKHNANLQPKCHRCQFRMKKDLLYTCNACSSILCYECLDVLTNHSLFEISKYKCAICLGHCKCSKCVKTSQPTQQGRNIKNQDFSSFLKQVQCPRCQIMNPYYDKITIQCTQCKIDKCYNCAKSQKRFQTSKMNVWICSDCKEFNQEIFDKKNKEAAIQISVDDNDDMNEEILEESVSRSASPPRLVARKSSMVEKKVSMDVESQKNSLAQSLAKSSIQVNVKANTAQLPKPKEEKKFQEAKNDNVDRDGKKQQKKRDDTKKWSKRSRSKSNSSERSRSRMKSKEKKAKKHSSDSSPSLERYKKKQSKYKPLWNNQEIKEKDKDKKMEKEKEKEKERQREREKEKEKEREKEKEKEKEREKEKEKKKEKETKRPNPSVPQTPVKRSGLIFQVNTSKKINDQQQQSY